MRCVIDEFLHHPLYLTQLIHHVHLGMQSTSRIYNDDISIHIYCLLHRIKCYWSGIGVHAMGDYRHIPPLAPLDELINSCSPKSICRSQHDEFAALLIMVCELSNGGSFPNTIPAYNDNDIGLFTGGYFKIV